MQLGRAWVVLFALWAGLSLAQPAQAQSKIPAGYKEAVAQALVELEAANYPEARAEFARAHALFPNARTSRGLGMVEFELRHYTESVRWLEQALASAVKPLDDKLRAETDALLERARRYLTRVSLQLSPDSATLLIDGKPAELAGTQDVVLEAGEHLLEARAVGYASERRSINALGGDHLDVQLTLDLLRPAHEEARGPVAQPHDVPASAPPSERTPAYRKWWVWTTVAVVVAGGATAAVLLLNRDRETREVPVQGTNTPGFGLQSWRQF